MRHTTQEPTKVAAAITPARWTGGNLSDWASFRGVGRDYAYSLIKSGQLKALKLGRLTWVSPEADAALISSLPPL